MIQSAGVYVLRNNATGKEYVGSATNLRRRWYEHQSTLRRGVHHSIKLQRSWQKHGASAFVFLPVLVCAPEMAVAYEQLVIDATKPWYNISPTAGSSLGVKHTLETRTRMSEANKGKALSPEHKAALSRKGATNTPEHNAKIAKAHVGLPCSAETRAKLAAANIGKKASEASKQKTSAALKGRQKTTQHRENMRLAWVKRKAAL